MTEIAARSLTLPYEQATSYRRLAARFIDLVMAGFVLTLLGVALAMGLATFITGAGANDAALQAWFWGVFAVLLLAYDTLLHSLLGGTIGKLLLGMRVVTAQGQKLGLARSLARALALYALGLVVAFLVVITMSLFGWILFRALGKYERLPHDALARSYVVRVRKGAFVPVHVAPMVPAESPAAELDRLRSQGMISEQEYERKKNELGS